MRQKFSILTASYNKAAYLHEWKESIFLQDYRPLEVIFVNDFSTDNTMDVVNSFKDEFNNKGIDLIIINNKDRLYCSSSYNISLSASSGFFLGVLDADDKLEKNACGVVVEHYDRHPDVSWIYTQHFFCNIKINRLKKGMSSYPSYGSLLESGLKGQHCFSHWRTFSRRLNGVSGIFKDGLRCSVDKYMGYKLEEKGVGGFLNIPLYYYRYGDKNSVVKVEKTIPMWKEIIEECLSYRKNNNIKVFKIITL